MMHAYGIHHLSCCPRIATKTLNQTKAEAEQLRNLQINTDEGASLILATMVCVHVHVHTYVAVWYMYNMQHVDQQKLNFAYLSFLIESHHPTN